MECFIFQKFDMIRRLSICFNMFLILIVFFIQNSDALSGNEQVTLKPKVGKLLSEDSGKHQRSLLDTVNSTCQTSPCVALAATIIESMNAKNKDPCNDFYNYVCGNILEDDNVPGDRNLLSYKSVIEYTHSELLRTYILETNISSDPIPFVLVKNFYEACLNKELYAHNSLNYLNDIINIKEEWPIVKGQDWRYRTTNWMVKTIDYHEMGFDASYFMDIVSSVDSAGSSNLIVKIRQPSFGIPREYLVEGLGNPMVEAYKEYMIDVAIIFGADRYTAELDFISTIDFEIALAKATLSNDQRLDITKHTRKMTINDLQRQINNVNWAFYINSFVTPRMKLSGQDKVLLTDIPYFNAFNKLLQTRTAKTITNYIIWRIVLQVTPFLTGKFRSVYKKFKLVISGENNSQRQWEECIELTNRFLPVAVGAFYINRTNNNINHTAVHEMIQYVKEAYIQQINRNATWIVTPGDKIDAMNKIEAIAYNIDLTPELSDKGLLETYYNNFDIDSTNFLKSILNAYNLKKKIHFTVLPLTINRTYWNTRENILSMQPSYSLIQNYLDLPFRLFNSIYYSDFHPNPINFGAFGAILAHQMSYAIDKFGSQFGRNGEEIQWWHEETKSKYDNLARFLTKKYNSYTDNEDNIHVNGAKTARENIADLLGVKVAYSAYRNWATKHTDLASDTLLGLTQYDGNKLFWISYAHMYCSVYDEKAEKRLFIYGEQAPSKYRVLGPLSITKAFRRDFNCTK